MKLFVTVAVASATTIAFVPAAARANVTLPAIFADNMMLQRDRPVPVWGKADPGEVVTVTTPSGSQTATADANGKWMVRFEPLHPGAPFDLKISGHNTIVLSNVLAGDVWLASGQSNMEFPLKGSRTGTQDLEAELSKPVRVFLVTKQALAEPAQSYEGSWLAPSKQRKFSAVAYYFAHQLQEKTGVPIAVVGSYWGGSIIEAWTDRNTLEADPQLKPLVDDWRKQLASYPADLEKLNNVELPAWQAAVDRAKAEGKPPPEKPHLARANSTGSMGYMWNGMIEPLIPFAIKGVIWYQGESNAGPPYIYDRLFATLIADWRKQWGEGDFPFYFVQLANQGSTLQTEPVESGWQGWMEVRDAQQKTLALPNTGMAVTVDLANDPGDPGAVHYLDKDDVGKRLALWALAKDYGQNVPYSSPLFDSAQIEGSTMKIRFRGAETGLVAKGGSSLKGFAVAGSDKKWAWAQAAIAGDVVTLSSPDVPHPVAARYDWANNPIGNLYNGAGLPASQFRTDADR